MPREAASKRPAGSRALAAWCRGCLYRRRVLGAQIFPCPCFLSLCQKYRSNGSVSGYSGSQEPPCVGVCRLCSSLDLLAPPLLKESKCGLLDSQDGCLAYIQAGIYRHPQVLFGRVPIQLPSPESFALVPVEALAPPDVPICLTSHRPAMLAEPCSACRTSVPAFSADTIAVAAHQVVRARLFSWKRWVCGIQVLRGGKADVSASRNAGAGCCCLTRLSEPSS